MKRFLHSGFMALSLLLLSAGINAANYLKITDSTGQSVTFALSEKPKATLTATNLVITTASDTLYYPLTQYRKFELTDNETTSISTPTEANGNNIVVKMGQGSLLFEGLEPSSGVTAYAIDGSLTGSTKASSNGNATLNLNGQKGIIIVKTNNKTFKFLNK